MRIEKELNGGVPALDVRRVLRRSVHGDAVEGSRLLASSSWDPAASISDW